MRVLARIISGSRLHLGFYNVNYSGIKFGGIGLYLQEPKIIVEAIEGEKSFIGFPEELISPVSNIINDICQSEKNFSLLIKKSPPLHVGLGVSTQILLSTAKLASIICNKKLTFKDLAKLSGRGKYSGIGIYAFHKGGFLVDGGKLNNEDYPPLIYRSRFPDNWAIVLVLPRNKRGLRDDEESVILDTLISITEEEKSMELISIALTKIIRGVSTRDFDSFTHGVEVLQRKIGEIFAKYQGGIFSNVETSMAIDALLKSGFRGTGQSSWGPIAYGFTEEREAGTKIKRLLEIINKEELDFEVLVTKSRNRGAYVKK